ncbi:MAG TPA: hypothetical protein VHZ32_02460, partial [Rhizomicrobium sp.]|nr:hypothetical protein [Rhizomicrobium sp.]
ISGFVQSLATPTRATGKIARWQQGICPVALGLKPAFLRFVVQQVKDIAAKVGAPVNGDPACAPNIEIVFTTAPQALLDNIKKRQPGFLGYADNQTQRDQLATVNHPIQAWYTTATQDLNGKVEIDSGKTAGPGLEVYLPCPDEPRGVCLMHLPNAHAVAVTGSRLGDGLKSGLYNVIIVADPTRLTEYEMGSLGDYITMLALSQIGSLDGCEPLPSIVNMLARDCDRKTSILTDNDRAYLTGLYRMGPEAAPRVQQDEIAYQMEKSLLGK